MLKVKFMFLKVSGYCVENVLKENGASMDVNRQLGG